MATLIFCIFNFQGELNGSLSLAKKLRAMGHQIYYLGLADSRENVQSHGFEFLTILENWFPVGFFRKLDFNHTNQVNLALRRIGFIKDLKRFIHSLIHENNKEIHLILKKFNPDLLILSTTEGAYATFLGIIAYECKIPSIYLTDMFPSLPFYSDTQTNYTENDEAFNLQKSVNFWRIHTWKNLIINSLGIDVNYKESIYEFSAKIKIPSEMLDLSRDSPLILPHLFLCPKEFDLPSIVRESCYYAEPSIDLSREENFNFCWDNLDKNKKIIYCSFGTTSGTFEALGIDKVKKIFQAVIDSISLYFNDDYQLVISVGAYMNAKTFKFSSGNIVIQSQFPQLALLEKSSLAIIAGGIHTVKECIFFGVPMIVFPVWADQFDNAERVKHHNLGLIGDIESVSVEYLTELIRIILSNLIFQKNLELWKQNFREIEASNRSTQFILETIKSINIDFKF